MSPAKRYAKKQARARGRRRLNAQQRLDRDRRQAQQAAEALHQALEELGLPETLVREIEGRLQSQQKLLGKIVGVMFPALFGCRTPLGALSGAGLGQELALASVACLTQTLLAQTAAASGPRGIGAALAPCRRQECRDPKPLAVDVGRG
jgi:hypothetical protein